MGTQNNAIIRGKILYYLALIYPQAATFALVQGNLQLFGYPAPMDELDLHLTYLVKKKLVSLDKFNRSHRVRRVRVVKITAKGIDYHDGRLPQDEGIYVEPK
jgi:hypothetical protein